MVNHAEASRLNIERMKQIYQQLSRYRGLGMIIEYLIYLFIYLKLLSPSSNSKFSLSSESQG